LYDGLPVSKTPELPRVYWRVKLSKDELHGTEKSPPKYTAEFRERGVRLFQENRSNYSSDNAAFKAIAAKLGCSPDSLRLWFQQSERDAGARSGLSSADKDRLEALERENKELRTANEILKKGEAIFRHWSEDNGRAHILPRRSSTARSADDRFY